MAITDAVVPVAGLGTRLLPATKSQPKEMLPVGAKPVVQHVVEELRESGIERVLFVTGRRKGAIEDHFDHDPELDRALHERGRDALLAELRYEDMGVQFLYTRQPHQRGLGDAVMHAERFAGASAFAVALGDTIIGRHRQSGIVARLGEAMERFDAVCAIAVERVVPERASRYGIVAPAPASREDQPFALQGIVEKPAPGTAPSDLAVAARYAFTPRLFDALREISSGVDGELQLTDAIALLLAGGETVVAVPLSPDERRYDIGSVESYCRTFLEFALTDPELGESMREHVRALLA